MKDERIAGASAAAFGRSRLPGFYAGGVASGGGDYRGVVRVVAGGCLTGESAGTKDRLSESFEPDREGDDDVFIGQQQISAVAGRSAVSDVGGPVDRVQPDELDESGMA